MTHRERALAILHYQPYDRLPIVHFGFWRETITKWHLEGHLPRNTAEDWTDGNEADQEIEPGSKVRVVQVLPNLKLKVKKI